MTLSEMVMTLLRIIVSAIITGALTVAVNLIWRHGKRWFRGARKFARTGRWGGGRTRSGQTRRSAPTMTAERMPRLTMEQRFMLFLARLNGKTAPPALRAPSPNTSYLERDEDLDLKF